jgi:ubiquinone biosynthesis protein
MLSIRKLGVIGRTYRHLNRYRQILAVFLSYGFGDLLDLLKLDQYIEAGIKLISRERAAPVNRHSRAVRIRMAIEELGPTYVKFGQILSTRPDLIPMDLVNELARLQDNVPPCGFDEISAVVEKELGVGPDEAFAEFESEPLASASIGQVHRAVLEGGDPVAVKIQRPGMKKIIEVDLEIMLHLATLMERHIEEFAFYRPVKIVEEFARALEKEIDYTLEAASMERVASYYVDDPDVYIPKVYRQATTSKVLVMEFVDGIKISDIDKLKGNGLDLKTITRKGADFYLDQIFKHGFFHADPHPGNIYILPGEVICLFDFGMMGTVDLHTREDFVDLIDNVVHKRATKTIRVLLKLTEWDHEPDMRRLEKDATEFMESYLFKSLQEIQIGKLLNRLMDLASRHRLRIPPDTFLMMKALATIEGVARMLDPEFDMTSRTVPFIEGVKLARFRPERITEDILRFGSEMLHFLDRFPKDLLQITRQIRRQKLVVRFVNEGQDDLIAAHHQISNRIAFSIIIAALLVGSALIVISKTPPLFYGISLIGIIGFLFAAVMGIWLLIAIIRKGRL